MADDTTPEITLPDVLITPDEDKADNGGAGAMPNGALDQISAARQYGYDWPEIDQHMARIRQAADQLGYSESEVDQQFGYKDPKIVGDQLDAMAQSAVANADPGTHPLTAASHGLLDPLNDKTGLVEGGAIPAAIRGTYANALTDGGVKGPDDFSQMFQQAAVDASGDPTNNDMAEFGMKSLTGNFPDNRELTDYALGLAQHMDLDVGPQDIGNIKRNLMSVWTETGIPLQSIFQQAVADPRAADAITKPPLDTFGPLPGDLHLNPDLPTKGVTRPLAAGEYLNNPDGSWSNEMSWTVDVKGKPSVVPGLWLVNGTPTHVNENTAARYAEASGLKFPSFATQQEAEDYANNRETQWQDKQKGDTSVPGLWTGKIKDPSKIQQAIPQDAVVDPLGNMTSDPTGLFGTVNHLSHIVGEEYDHTQKVKEMEAAKNEDGTPKYTDEQIFHEKMESPTLKLLAQILVTKGTGELTGAAYSALTSGDMATTLRALAADESGQLKKLAPGVIIGDNLIRQAMSSEEHAAWVASKPGEYGQATMRELGMGLPDMAFDIAKTALEPYMKELNKHVPEFRRELAGPRGSNYDPITNTYVPRSTLRNLMDNIEGKAGEPGVVAIDENSPLHPVMTAIRVIDDKMWGEINRRVEAGDINPVGFVEDHFAHMWERPDEATRIFSGGRGSQRFLRERTIPTMGDGIDAGLTPKILNPIESELAYMHTTLRWLGNADVRADGVAHGVITYGAKLEPGNGFLNGTNAIVGGQRAQAPLAYSSAYNYWVGRGVYDWPVKPIGDTGMTVNPGKIYDKVQMAVNGATGLKLALGVLYHSKAVIQETIASGAALAWGGLTEGTWEGFKEGLKTAGYTATILPQLIRTERIGANLAKQYNRTADFGPQYEAIKNYLASANMRMGGRRAFGGVTSGADITNAGPMNNLFTAYKRGSIMLEQSDAIRKVFGLPNESALKSTVLSGPRVLELAFKELGMVNDTLNHLPFDVAIPHLKMGVAALEVDRYLRRYPTATHEETMKKVRDIVDSVDNRLGELNQDNLFWNRGVKQTFNLYTVSLGWELGTLRAFGGGGSKFVQGAGQLVRGKAPVAWDTVQARWMLGFPVALALTNAVTQYLTSPVPVGQGGTGELLKDLFVGGRTGGTNPDGSPERRLLPGYEKEFFDWAYDYNHSSLLLGKNYPNVRNPLQAAMLYIKGKANPAAQLAQSIFTGKEWFNWHDVVSKKPDGVSSTDWSSGLLSHFFSQPGQVAPGWLQYLRYLENQTDPVFNQNTPKPGTEIGTIGRLLGDKPVPHYIEQDTDPSPGGGRGRVYNGGGGGIPSGFGRSSGGSRGGGIPSGFGRSNRR